MARYNCVGLELDAYMANGKVDLMFAYSLPFYSAFVFLNLLVILSVLCH